jgi:hypothetical protein
MSVRVSQRSSREWLLLVAALLIVGGIVVPIWQNTASPETRAEFQKKWTPERFGKLLIGPEQAICYVCFTWAGLILIRRYLEVQRQRRAFGFDLLPTSEGSRILPEDARPLARKVDGAIQYGGPSILANMIRLGLGKYAISRSAPDVAEVVRNQGEVEASRFVATMNTVNYLAWAIPAVGFLGTVRGLAGAMGLQRAKDQDVQEYIDKYIDQVKDHLGTAFDCTFVALALSLVLMYLLHSVQRSEETLVIDCQEYCQEHLLMRLYDPQPADHPIALSGR